MDVWNKGRSPAEERNPRQKIKSLPAGNGISNIYRERLLERLFGCAIKNGIF